MKASDFHGYFILKLMACFPESSFPFLEVKDGLVKMLLSEIRPAGRSEIELRICQLVEQEITDPVFPTCPNHQFRIR